MGNVFFKLLNMSIAAGWLVLAVAALRLVFKKAPRWVFCVLWAMVALRLALPFSVQSPFSVVPSVNTVSVVTEPVSSDPVSVPDEYSAPQTAIPAEVSSPQGYVSPSEHSAPEEPVSRPAYTETVTPPAIPGIVDPAQTDNAHQQIQRIVIKTGIPAIDNTISAAETERAYTGEEQTGDIGAVLFWIWASGAALMASYAAFSYLRLRLRLRCSIKGADGAYVCDTIDTPFILGLFRPRIYVPSGMNGRERSYVLAHEKAHLRRFDHLWKPLGYLMLAAYWFNPLMWLAYIFFCRDIEIACDEKVVKTLDTESKAGYSQTLLDLNRPRRMISACPLAFGEVGVKERIKKVLSYKKPTLWILIAALLLTTVLAVCLMTDPKEKGPDEENSAEESSDESDDSSEESDSYEYFEFSKLSDGTYSIAAKQRTDLPEELVLPGTYNGKPVTKIAERAFYDRTGIKSVKIPESVIAINKMAFSGCTSLVNVELPQGLTTIASGAFKKCAFSEFIVPQSVTFIGSGAFGGCDSLQKIELPFIGETPAPTELPKGYIGHIFGTQFGEAEKVYEFIPRSLKEVVVAEGCVRIPYGAFAQCESLERITLPGSLISIGSFAFEGCGGLVEILYGSTADKWQTVQKSASWDRGSDGTYYDLNVVCTNESDPAVFEKNFKYELLEDGTYCVKLDYSEKTPEELVIPSEHEGAAVTAVELSDLRYVTRIVLPQTVTRVISLKDCTSLTDITLPDSVAEIGESAFVGCIKLKSVKIPKNVARIGVSPFAWCPSLETIEVDEGNERYRAVSGCLIDDATGTIIGSAVYCTVPADEKVKRIGPAALAGVRTENVVIPSNITEIGNSAFAESGARTITLSEGVTTLGMGLCEKCFDLKDLYIPVSVQAINENTFCLTIPDEDPELTIHYAGTKEQWAALTSEWPWDVKRLDRCVVCSDGPVTDDVPIESIPALEVSDFVSVDGGNIYYTCETFPGKTAVIKTENTGGLATLKEFFVIDAECTDPGEEYLYRVYRGRRYTRSKDGSFDPKRTYAVVDLQIAYYRCIEDVPEILGELVIVDYKDEHGLGEGEGKSVVAPFTGIGMVGEYGDQVLLNEGSGFAVCFGMPLVPIPDWPLWRVYDSAGHIRTLPVEDSQRWSVSHVEFDKSNSDPDAVIVTLENGNTFKANLRDTRVLADDEETYYYYFYESSRSDSVPEIIYKGVIDPNSNLEGVKKVVVFPGENEYPVFTIKREYKEVSVGSTSTTGKMNMYVADYIVREDGVNRVVPDNIVVTYKNENDPNAAPEIIPLAGMLDSASDLHNIDVFGKVYTYYRSYIADNVHYNETHVFCVPEAEKTLRHIVCQYASNSYDNQYLVLKFYGNGTRIWYMIVDRAGNIRSLPVPDDRIGDVTRVYSVNLDADGGLDGYDPGDMIVTFASGETVTAKLSDTRVLTGKEADEYYSVYGAQRDIYGYSLNGYGGYNLNMKVAVNDPVLELPSFHNGLPVNMVAITGANAKRIAVPETVIYLTLSECRELTSATLPASLKELGDFAFKDCPKLSTIYYAGTVEQWNAIIKGEDWDEAMDGYVIICSDGYVAYEYRFENPTAAPVYLVQWRQTSVTQWETTESPGTLSYAQALEELANGNWIDSNGETPEAIEAPIYVFDCQMVCESGIPGFEGSVPFYRFTVETELDPGQVYAYVPAVKIN
jgi:beta-lactamase regulating signal transducer with metallopeptidase domain